MKPLGQLGLELLQNLLDFRELFHCSNLGNVARTEIAHSVTGIAAVWAFVNRLAGTTANS